MQLSVHHQQSKGLVMVRVRATVLMVACSMAIGLPAAAKSESVFTPAPGSNERTAILDALRSGTEVFVVEEMNVQVTDCGASAFVIADSGGASAISALLVSDRDGPWLPILIMNDGSEICGQDMAHRFETVAAAIEEHGGNADSIMPGFSELVVEVASSDGLHCLPDVSFPSLE
nr:hypothetical protein [uncultured Devosia sp.]